MGSLAGLKRWIVVAALFIFMRPLLSQEITNVNSLTVRPTPGSGAGYIHGLNEIENPANGSVSLRMNVPLPKGRGITLPFSIVFDTIGKYNITDGGSGTGRADFTGPGPELFERMAGPYTGLGFRYTMPFIIALGPFNFTDPDLGRECYFWTDYVFSDTSGSKHLLSMSPGGGDAYCLGSFGFNITNGVCADYFCAATPSTSAESPLDVTDYDGTVFHFSYLGNCPTWGHYSGNTLNLLCGIPDWMEDRNGNRLVPTFGANGDFTVTDTLGRTVISSSGNSLTVSGLSNPYTLNVGSINLNSNYNLGMMWVGAHFPPCQAPSFNFQGSGTAQRIASLTLPNGQSYQFGYDSNYGGMLNKNYIPIGRICEIHLGGQSRFRFSGVASARHGYVSGPLCHTFRYDRAPAARG